MSGYNTEYFISDFSERTQINYEKILNCRDANRFEVTQLINSLLGLVVIPSEAYFKQAREMSNIKLCRDEIKKIDTIVRKCVETKKYYCDYESVNAIDFIKHIRNSVAHGGNKGLMFYPITEGGGESIDSVVFYDEDRGKKFCVEIEKNDLREFVKATAELYRKIEKKARKDDWKERVEKCQELFGQDSHNYKTYEEEIIHG